MGWWVASAIRLINDLYPGRVGREGRGGRGGCGDIGREIVDCEANVVEVAAGRRGSDNDSVGRGNPGRGRDEEEKRRRARAFTLGLLMPVYNEPVLIPKWEPEEPGLMEEM